MNRNIEFRGYVSELKKWVYGDLIQRDYASFIFTVDAENFEDRIRVNPKTVGQFTGLMDIKDKKIFENDFCIVNGHLCIIKYRKNFCDFIFEEIKHASRILNVTKANITKYNIEIKGEFTSLPKY